MVELLIAIIVLGIISVVVVFAVGGLRGGATEASCATDSNTLSLAEDAFHTQHGRYATEAELAQTGTIRSESRLNDITLTGNTFTVTTVAQCTPGNTDPIAAIDSPTATTTTTSTPTTTSTIPSSATTTTTTPPTTTTTTTTTPPTTTTTLSPTTSPTVPPTTTATPPTTVPVATKLTISVQPTNTSANAAINPSVVVTVQDAAGQLVATNTATITLTITSNTGSPAGRLTCTANPKAAIAGVVTFSTCAINKTANNYKLTATSPGLTSSVSTSFNIT